MKKIVPFVVILLFLISCESSEDIKSLEVNKTRISIPLGPEQLNSYQVWSSYFEKGNKLVAYNDRMHHLDFFDLDDQKVISSVPLEKEGPYGLGRIESIYRHAADSIFLYERGKLHILSLLGEKVETFDLYKIYGNLNLGEPVCNFYFKLNYREESKEVFFFMLNPTDDIEEKSQHSLVTSLSLENETVKTLPIKHTEHFKNVNGHVGFITYLGFTGFLNERMIYNFQYESPVFAFSPISGKIAQGKVHEDKMINEVLTLEDPEVFDRHAIDNPHFLSPVPDPWKDKIYRFMWGAPDPNLDENGFTEKSSSISVFDSDLNLLQEFSLPNYTYQINNWFVNENGFYMNVAHPMNETTSEDFLVFDIFKFNVD
ncbi:DUF4221 family protein [Algoriphagus namhaensis]|uniref:DUF4221 family protein n=1 Tax=Algoriphagus namhaensis TaxID=915353 RepID=A0ABV8AQJ8_9BACT